MENKYTFDDFLDIVKRLRGENGCEWDRAQTHETLTKYLIEESYEYIEATLNKEPQKQMDELGDVLLQVVMNAQIAKEKGDFDINDVVNAVSKKMVYRHPHVFSDVTVSGVDDILKNWEDLKKKEQNIKKDKDILLSVSKALPALVRAQKVIEKIEKIEKNKKIKSFNEESIDKFDNLLDNIREQVDISHKNKIFGEALIALIYLASKEGISVEMCLNESIDQLIDRFN